ncbi:MAG: SUMF1/EgtB/PvdO family nonheme iron enzyme [Chloroflexi bacterium]|nr:SUMF1/EgtB/PvdO family nonheme iron enzyme [Chloroflexota bacterium]
MTSVDNRPLRVFLCHSSNDKPAIRELYQKLRAEPWIQPWLDEEELYPGQDWETEIEKAVESSDVVLVCLSNGSINKRGFVQKELRFALDVALEMPEETIFIVPLRLEECTPPRSLRDWQYSDYFEGQRERALGRLLVSLKMRADSLGLKHGQPTPPQKMKPIEETPMQKKENKPEGNRFEKSYARAQKLVAEANERVQKNIEGRKPAEAIPVAQPEHLTTDWIAKNKLTLSNGMEFMRVPAGEFLMGSDTSVDSEKPLHSANIPYDYWLARFPMANKLYNEYLKANGKMILPYGSALRAFHDDRDHPAVDMKWLNAIAYCRWLNSIYKAELPSGLILRLPTEAEWEKASRGIDGRDYPWGNTFDKNKCNSGHSGHNGTTPVDFYSPQGDSPYGCADMVGNVFEWTCSLFMPYPYNRQNETERINNNLIAIRGNSYFSTAKLLKTFIRGQSLPSNNARITGFRVCLAPPVPK